LNPNIDGVNAYGPYSGTSLIKFIKNILGKDVPKYAPSKLSLHPLVLVACDDL